MYLESFATNVFVRKLAPDDIIISTNYDIVLDNALLEISNTNYGFRVRKPIFPVSYSDGTLRAGHSPLISINQGKIKLLKIHGSLNWLYCPRCNEVDVTLAEKGISYLGKEYRLLCSNTNCTSEYEPLIVTPTRFKMYENRILREIWAMARELISKAEEIVFIGYSLPEADTELKCLLLYGLNEAVQKPKITFVDQPEGSKDIESYKKLFGTVQYLPVGFVEYVNRMLP
ncbi:MAG: SIR2 family protein [Candidatus Omnitrophica bacterium]|nr:SIR2 family protein [Candidatus Omnitrophota bacterium]